MHMYYLCFTLTLPYAIKFILQCSNWVHLLLSTNHCLNFHKYTAQSNDMFASYDISAKLTLQLLGATEVHWSTILNLITSIFHVIVRSFYHSAVHRPLFFLSCYSNKISLRFAACMDVHTRYN